MASTAPQNPNLPLLYKELVPISQQEHGDWRYKTNDAAPFLYTEHAIPVTVEVPVPSAFRTSVRPASLVSDA